jgi:hypothetical protein
MLSQIEDNRAVSQLRGALLPYSYILFLNVYMGVSQGGGLGL